MTITDLDYKTKISKLCCLIGLLYMDIKSYKYTFRFLKENII